MQPRLATAGIYRKYESIFFQPTCRQKRGWLVAGRILHMALAFLVNLLTARYLGPSNYGLVNYAALYTAFFTSFATLGLSSHPFEGLYG